LVEEKASDGADNLHNERSKDQTEPALGEIKEVQGSTYPEHALSAGVDGENTSVVLVAEVLIQVNDTDLLAYGRHHTLAH